MVGEETEEELTEESTDRVCDLDTKVLVVGACFTLVVDVTDHGGRERNTENVVGIGKESDTWYSVSIVFQDK